MPVTITAGEAPGWVADRLAGRTGTRWIGIDGFGAAGKTTLAAAIAAALPGAVVVPVDDFARPGLRGWDRERFVGQVRRAAAGRSAGPLSALGLRRRRGAEWLEVPAGVPVIVEGVSATDDRVGVPWDLTLWLEVAADVRWRRVLDRDDPAAARRSGGPTGSPASRRTRPQQRPWERVDARR